MLKITLLSTFLCFVGFVSSAQNSYQDCVADASDYIGGHVYMDYNSNGTWETSGAYCEDGIQGVQVKIYSVGDALITTVITGLDGGWGANTGATVAVRVEFVLPNWLESSFGTNTTVQAVKAPDCQVNLGVIIPGEFCEEDPELVTECFTRHWSPATNPTIISIDYSDGGNSTTAIGPYQETTHPIMVTAAESGTTWGIAYSKKHDIIYSAISYKIEGFPATVTGSTLLRDLGTIFYIDNSTNTGLHNTVNTTDSLTTIAGAGDYCFEDFGGWDWEKWGGVWGGEDWQQCFAEAMKKGIGDVDINTANDTLYTVNLNTQRLCILPLAADGKSTLGVSEIMPPTPASCSGEMLRPYGLKYYRGKVYAGYTCTGELTNDPTKLRGYIYEYTPGDAAFNATPVLEFDFNYPRGASMLSGAKGVVPAKWNTWLDTLNSTTHKLDSVHYKWDGSALSYPQPIISDIEFDKGDMIIAVMDRFGEQGYTYVGSDPCGNFANVEPQAATAGDILKAAKDATSTFQLENNGTVASAINGSYTSATGAGTAQGPGNGEFYNGDKYYVEHEEITTGGLAQLPGAGDIVIGAFDPSDPLSANILRWASGGFIWLSNRDGSYTKGYEAYHEDPQTAAKGNGFGDIELICDSLAPIQIGNIIWEDADGDGIQDPDELPIGGLVVNLYDAAGNLIATTTTLADGSWFFDSSDGIEPNSSYTVALDATQWNNGELTAGSPGATNTSQNTGGGSDNDINDNDAADDGASGIPAVDGVSLPYISFSTDEPGENNHTLDFGFLPVTLSVELTAFNVVPNNCQSQLNWETGSEEDNKLFVVEKSIDGNNFKEIGRIIAENQPSSYEFIDPAFTTDAYYRLKIIDLFDEFTFSPTRVAISKCSNIGQWAVYPNPVVDDVLRLKFEHEVLEETTVLIQVYDELGKMLIRETHQVQNGVIQAPVNVSDLVEGIYTIDLHQNNVPLGSQLFVKAAH